MNDAIIAYKMFAYKHLFFIDFVASSKIRPCLFLIDFGRRRNAYF